MAEQAELPPVTEIDSSAGAQGGDDIVSYGIVPKARAFGLPREPLGDRARRVFQEWPVNSTRLDPGHPWAHIWIAPFLVDVARLLIWWWQTAGRVSKATGIARRFQFFDIIRMTWPHRFHGQIYYMFELYRPEEKARRGEYLTRWETKNGLIRLLRQQFIDKSVARSNMRDKVAFTVSLAKHGLPGIPIIASFDRGKPTPAEIDPKLLRQDLFTKLRAGKGAQGAGLIRYLGDDRYRYGSREFDCAGLLQQLAKQSERANLILLPRLTNHPDIAGLAVETLMAVRTFSMINERGQPEVVFAMLRVLGKLEPTWHSRVEWAAAIDLETGELGLLAGDVPEEFTRRYTHHPFTGYPVQGVILPYWQEVKATALAVHRQLAMDRFVVGWDIAVTPTGPRVLEGNVLPDVTFPQRVGHRPFGQTRYGEILHYHLDRVELLLKERAAKAGA
ncbi:MAG TPA: sugar-transfer associated ATP-grasp domain-containing protein [Dongiaceae bacterium]|nr:sugar-transfer associated ATP-grasp domain-containing protein [Dongiaceae bacterium]